MNLYRHFDGKGRLLYVGISICAVRRLRQHEAGSRWFSDVRKVTIEKCKDLQSALKQEGIAIIKEKPLMNLAPPRAVVITEPEAFCAPDKWRPKKATLLNVFEYYGGTITNVARNLGLSYGYVCDWVHAKRVPIRTQKRLERETGGELKADKKK